MAKKKKEVEKVVVSVEVEAGVYEDLDIRATAFNTIVELQQGVHQKQLLMKTKHDQYKTAKQEYEAAVEFLMEQIVALGREEPLFDQANQDDTPDKGEDENMTAEELAGVKDD